MAITHSTNPLLPRFATFKGDNGQFLTIAITDGIPYLTFTALDPCRLATHQIIPSKDTPDVVFIRSSNGRFWSRNSDNWIVASRDESPPPSPPENSSYAFRVTRITPTTIALQSLLDGSYLRWYSQSQLQHGFNAVASCCDPHTHLELCSSPETAVVLPRLLTLRSDNGLFLDAKYQRDINWLSFTSSKLDNIAVAHELAWLPNGNVMIQNVASCKFWRASCVNWVWADVDQCNAISNSACHFEPVKLSSTTIAFRSISSNRFLRRYTEYWTDALCSLACGVNDPSTHFVVGDAVISQSLAKISYSLKLAEVVEVKSVCVGVGSLTNEGECVADLQVQVSFSKSLAKSHNWSDSSTFDQISPVSSFTVGVPEVCSAQGSITVGALQCFKTKLSSTINETVQFQSTYTVKDVEPGEEVSVKVECMQGRCRVPFTYTAKKVRLDGVGLPELECIDGLFEGVSVFDTRATVTSSARKTPTYLPVCCTFGSRSRGARRAAL